MPFHPVAAVFTLTQMCCVPYCHAEIAQSSFQLQSAFQVAEQKLSCYVDASKSRASHSFLAVKLNLPNPPTAYPRTAAYQKHIGETRSDRRPSHLEEYKYIGNSVSNKFHRPWCLFEQAMNPDHALFFPYRKDAIAKGFIPCRWCLPPFTKQVRCTVINPTGTQYQLPVSLPNCGKALP